MVSESEVVLRRHTYRLIAWGIMFSALRLVPLLEPYGSFATQQHKIVTVFLLVMIFLSLGAYQCALTREPVEQEVMRRSCKVFFPSVKTHDNP